MDDISFSKRRINRGYTYLCAGSVICVSLLRAPQYSTFACCLIPVLTLAVLLVMLDDIDDISFSKRGYFLIVSRKSISVYCIPTRDTHITRDICMGIHISRGYTYHCDTGGYIFQRPFLRGLFLEGLIFGGAYMWREICVSKSIELALFLEGNLPFFFVLLCIWGQFPSTRSRGGFYLEERFNQMSHRYVSGVLQNDWSQEVIAVDSQWRCYIWVTLSYKTVNTVVFSLYH